MDAVWEFLAPVNGFDLLLILAAVGVVLVGVLVGAGVGEQDPGEKNADRDRGDAQE